VADYLTDAEISRLVEEIKPLPADFRARMKLKAKRGHHERDLDLKGQDGGDFVILIRQSAFDPLNFSVILACRPAGSLRLFRLRRYNGDGHEHSNRIEGDRFIGPHIHIATERYQLIGTSEDAYAVVTDRYVDLDGAITALLGDCGFMTQPPPGQTTLFQVN
jgi:hypothetical protein